MPRVAAVIEIDSGQLGVNTAIAGLQQLQNLFEYPGKTKSGGDGVTDGDRGTETSNHQCRPVGFCPTEKTDRHVTVEYGMSGGLKLRIALGNYFTGSSSIARFLPHRLHHAQIGKLYYPEQRSYNYQDLMLPVLLDSLRGGWQTSELVRPMQKLKIMDSNGLLRRTLMAWFKHNNATHCDSKIPLYS